MDLLRHLEYFLAVADARSFSQAAESLGMAQPPLSQRIRALEGHLGVELFDRSRRQIQLTEAGGLLVAEARVMLQMAADLRLILHSPRAQAELRIQVPSTLPSAMLADIGRELSSSLGERVRPDVIPAATRAAGHTAYALVPGTDDPDTRVSLPLGLAMKPTHPLLEAGVEPHPSDFADGLVIVLDEDSWQEAWLRAALENLGLPHRAISVGGNPDSAPASVALDDTACLTDQLHAAAHQLAWVPATPGLVRSWRVTGRRSNEVAQLIQGIIDRWCARE